MDSSFNNAMARVSIYPKYFHRSVPAIYGFVQFNKFQKIFIHKKCSLALILFSLIIDNL